MGFTGGFGMTFNIGSAAMSGSPTYTAIAQVREWNGVEVAAILSEVTHHASTGGFREKIPSGLFEVSDLELKLAFDISEATHANSSGGLTHALLNKLKRAFQIVLPDSSTTTWTFDAYVQKIKWESPQEEHVMATVTLTVTGQPTIA